MKYLKREHRLAALKEQSLETSRWYRESAAVSPLLLNRESTPEALRASYEMLPLLNWIGGHVVQKHEVDLPVAVRHDPMEFCRLVLVFWLRELAEQFGGKMLVGRSPHLPQPNAFIVRELSDEHISSASTVVRIDGNIAVFELFENAHISRIDGYSPLHALSQSDDRFIHQCESWHAQNAARQYSSQAPRAGCLSFYIASFWFMLTIGSVKAAFFDSSAGPARGVALAYSILLVGSAVFIVSRRVLRKRKQIMQLSALQLRDSFNGLPFAGLLQDAPFRRQPDHQNFVSRVYSTLERVSERVRLFFEERR